MTKQNERLGILLMIITTIVFASQDGLSKYLATEYNVYMVVMLRYWFFAAFVISMSSRRTGGIKLVAKTKSPILQIFRSLILVAEMCITILAFTLLGLAETHAIFASYPLIIAITAITRLIILQKKDLDPSILIYESVAIMIIAVAIIVLRLRYLSFLKPKRNYK